MAGLTWTDTQMHGVFVLLDCKAKTHTCSRIHLSLTAFPPTSSSDDHWMWTSLVVPNSMTFKKGSAELDTKKSSNQNAIGDVSVL